MSDFERTLRDSLSRAVDAAPAPAPFDGVVAMRVRRRTAMYAAIAVVGLLLVAGGAAVGVRLFSEPTPKPANPDVEMGPWTRNLYVLDPGNLSKRSFVYSLAETNGPQLVRQLTAGYYPAGYDPQMTLSPDGSRLYAISSLMPDGVESYRNVIDTYDTTTPERIARTTLPELDGVNRNRTLHKGPVFTPDFVASGDGSRLYIGEQTQRRGPVRAQALIGTFDTETSALLANSFEITDCNTRVLLPGDEASKLNVVCSATGNHVSVPATNFVYFLEVADDGSLVDSRRLDLPPTGDGLDEIAWAQASPDGRTIYAVTQDGHVFVVDAERRDLDDDADLEIFPNDKVQMQKVAISSDGSTLYLGTAPVGRSTVLEAKGIASYDTQTWEQIASGEADDYFWTMTLGPGGRRLYAPTFGEPTWSIQVFHARTLEQLGTIEDVGDTPALIEVPRLGR